MNISISKLNKQALYTHVKLLKEQLSTSEWFNNTLEEEIVELKKEVVNIVNIKNKQIEKEKKQEEEWKLKDPKCSYVGTKGERCKISVSNAGDKCTVHESVPQNETGKKTQCKGTRTNGERCGMQTSNKSGYCYYHD